MIDTDFLEVLKKFNLIVRKRITSNYTGERRSIAKGRGMIFQDLRQYAPGDDFRAIDWKVFARTDRLHIRQYEEDKSLTTHILLDFSESMNFGGKRKKSDYASMLGIGYAYLALQGNDKFQISTFGDRLEAVDSKKGMHHLAVIVDYLNSKKPKGGSNFKDALMQYRKMLDSRSLIVIISDLLFDLEQIKQGLYSLGDGHEIRVIQVLHPVEANMGLKGNVKLKDSETKKVLKTYISQRVKQEYKRRLHAHTIEVERICRSMKAKFFQVASDTSVFDAFYKILQ